MFNLFKKKTVETKEPEGDKDPNDYTLTELSRPWKGEDSYCRKCKKKTSHNEFMSKICNGCGEFCSQALYGRSFRKLKIGGKWKVQYKYADGHSEVVDEEY